MSARTVQYVHLERDHNLIDPTEIVPVILEYFQPTTVCDVGCGLGTFLHVFKDFGKQVKGFDGPWVDRQLLYKHLTDAEFQEVHFEQGFPAVTQKYDLAICLEVAEHVREQNADQFMQFLTSLSDSVIFSAAIPFQGGDNHYNEQWEEYWEKKFNALGFKKYDIIRHRIWSNKKIRWWYRQNMVVYSKNDLSRFPSVSFEEAVTRECYENKTSLLWNFSGLVTPNAKVAVKSYVKTAMRKLLGEKNYHRFRGKK